MFGFIEKLKKIKKIIAVLLFSFIVLHGLSAAEGATQRFGLFIGSNNGGRSVLRYAVSDARSLSRVFGSMGGITGENNILLVEPSIADINRQLENLGRKSFLARQGGQRTELVFYYSGHSDENGILLSRESYGYRELRERINAIQMDMRIVILDSCSSGAITRAKGGVKTQPFLFDNSVSAEGYAFLTSSSADEVSQESDTIRSSYFTHSLLTGLRGAADSVGDGRVTLNELYRFAYSETLAKTETSVYGAQHPSYDIQISGSGDVVLTDIKGTSAGLLIAEEVTGRITIRDSSDFLVAELTKVSSKPMELGLEAGLYRITLQRGDAFFRAEIVLSENIRTPLGLGDFTLLAAAPENRIRGNLSDESETLPDPADVPVHWLNLQLLPGIDIMGHSKERAINRILFGLFLGIGDSIEGAGVASLGLINSGFVRGLQTSTVFNMADGYLEGIQASGVFNYTGEYVQGVQAAGIFNYAAGDVWGVQAAGLFNYAAGDVQGAQASGLFNITPGSITGIQASSVYNYARKIDGLQAAVVNVSGGGYGVQLGIVNFSETESIIPIGLVNIVKNGILHPAVYIDDMLFYNISFRSGTKHFYTILSLGAGGGALPGRGGDKLMISRAGVGNEFSFGKFFLDIDYLGGTILNLDTLPPFDKNDDLAENRDKRKSSQSALFQIRFTAGYKIFPHLGVFAGVSYDYIHQLAGDSPGQADLGPFLIGGAWNRNIHKLGFFGGVQF
jgi:hypothetical protein